MGTYTILLVDDEELALAGMENGVNWASLGIDHIYKADSMGSAVRVIERHPVDIMVSDIEMPGGSGLELIRWVREHYPEIVSIFYTCHAEFSYCQDAIRMGAADYVLKPIPYDELEEIIKKGILSVQKQKDTKNLETIWGELTKTPETDSPVDIVKRIITEHIQVELSREEFAKQVYMSPDYLTKLFRKETGMSLSDYIIQKRISIAKQLLATTGLSMVEISRRTGFSYSSYFTRIFKKKTGMTPQQYRESLQQKPE